MDSKEILKKLIIHTADEYIQDHEITENEILLIDDFADSLLNNIETLTEKMVGKNV